MKWRSRVVDRHAATQAGGTMQGDGADMLLIKVLVNFEQTGFVIHPGVQGLAQGRQLAACNNDNRTVDFGDYSDRNGFIIFKRCNGQRGASLLSFTARAESATAAR